jgi:hypothetical protein
MLSGIWAWSVIRSVATAGGYYSTTLTKVSASCIPKDWLQEWIEALVAE